MIRTPIPGGYYVDALVTGEFAALIPGKRIESSRGETPLPPGDEPLFVRITNVQGLQIAGQGHNTPLTWHWYEGAWSSRKAACGTSPVIFDNAGILHISDCGPGIGAQGWRYVAPDGSLVTGDATYGPRQGLSEYTDLSDAQDGSLLVGQGHDVGGVCVWDGKLRRLAEGSCFAVRTRRVGTDVVVSWYSVAPDGLQAEIVWATVAELHALPVVAPPVVIPPVEPPQPTEPPVSTPNELQAVLAIGRQHADLIPLNTTPACGTLTEWIALALNAIDPGWGLLSKNPGENQWRGHAVDAVIYRPTQQVIDLMSGAGDRDPGSTVPPADQHEIRLKWQEVGKRPGNDWMAPIQPTGTPTPVPTPTPTPNPDPLELRVAGLEVAVKLLIDTVGEHDGTIADLKARITALEDRPITPPGDLRVVGRTKQYGSSFLAHSHEIDLPVVRK